MNVLCPYCSKPWTKEMFEIYNTLCEFDSCEMIYLEVVCDCGKIVYVKRAFGDKSDPQDVEDLMEDVDDKFLQEIADKVKKPLDNSE